MSIGMTQSAGSQKMDFLSLLVTQLQNQNPLEPMSNQDMSAQLALFSQLEQLENLNQSFDQVLQNAQRSFANDMIGKRVSFVDMDATSPDGSPGLVRSGQVLEMEMFGDMEMLRIAEVDPLTLQIREFNIEAENVTSIIAPLENS